MSREIAKNGHTFNVRGLKRKEVKGLKKKGLDLSFLNPAVADDAVDAVFNLVFSPQEIEVIDEMDNLDALQIWKAVLSETYGDQGEEGNSSRSGSSSQTQNE